MSLNEKRKKATFGRICGGGTSTVTNLLNRARWRPQERPKEDMRSAPEVPIDQKGGVEEDFAHRKKVAKRDCRRTEGEEKRACKQDAIQGRRTQSALEESAFT